MQSNKNQSVFNDKSVKNIATWSFITLPFALLPIILLFLVSLFTGENISVITVTKEMFFFNIVMCADTLKTLHNESYTETIFSKIILGITIFVLVISSVLYGITLIYNKNLDINVFYLSMFLYISSAVIGFITQMRDGLQKE